MFAGFHVLEVVDCVVSLITLLTLRWPKSLYLELLHVCSATTNCLLVDKEQSCIKSAHTRCIIGSVGAIVVFSHWDKCVTSPEMVRHVIVNTYWVQVVG